jgi:hypothetical protein
MISKESPNKVTYKNKLLARLDVVRRNESRNTERGSVGHPYSDYSSNILTISQKMENYFLYSGYAYF